MTASESSAADILLDSNISKDIAEVCDEVKEGSEGEESLSVVGELLQLLTFLLSSGAAEGKGPIAEKAAVKALEELSLSFSARRDLLQLLLCGTILQCIEALSVSGCSLSPSTISKIEEGAAALLQSKGVPPEAKAAAVGVAFSLSLRSFCSRRLLSVAVEVAAVDVRVRFADGVMATYTVEAMEAEREGRGREGRGAKGEGEGSVFRSEGLAGAGFWLGAEAPVSFSLYQCTRLIERAMELVGEGEEREERRLLSAPPFEREEETITALFAAVDAYVTGLEILPSFAASPPAFPEKEAEKQPKGDGKERVEKAFEERADRGWIVELLSRPVSLWLAQKGEADEGSRRPFLAVLRAFRSCVNGKKKDEKREEKREEKRGEGEKEREKERERGRRAIAEGFLPALLALTAGEEENFARLAVEEGVAELLESWLESASVDEEDGWQCVSAVILNLFAEAGDGSPFDEQTTSRLCGYFLRVLPSIVVEKEEGEDVEEKKEKAKRERERARGLNAVTKLHFAAAAAALLRAVSPSLLAEEEKRKALRLLRAVQRQATSSLLREEEVEEEGRAVENEGDGALTLSEEARRRRSALGSEEEIEGLVQLLNMTLSTFD